MALLMARERRAKGPTAQHGDDSEHDGNGQRARDLESTPASPPHIGYRRNNSSDTASLHSLRKRSSFFGRSNSDASSIRRAPATSHSSRPSFGVGRPQGDGLRPTTSASSDMRRRKTDPLQSIRDSLFGGKKKPVKDSPEASSSRPASRGTEDLPFEASGQPSNYRSEQEYYRHLRKHSISPPFNFQHVTHTARNQLSQLETVDEKDLPGQFWSVAAYQRPRRRVHGIKVDDLELKHRQMGLIRESPEPSPAFSPPDSPPALPPPQPGQLTVPEGPADSEPRLISPIAPISPFDARIPVTIEQYPEASDSSPELSSSSEKSPHTSEQWPMRHPKRYSSLNILSQGFKPPADRPTGNGASPELQSPECFYDSNSSSDEARNQSPKQSVSAPKTTVPPLNASMPPNFSNDYDVAFRARQPLLSLPPQPRAAKKKPVSTLQITHTSATSMLSPTLPPTKPVSPKSRRSSRSSRSAKRSPGLSRSSTDLRKSAMFSVSDLSWEDSVDLAYEEAAESTCDFAWNERVRQTASLSIASKEDSASHCSDDKRDSAATDCTGSPGLSVISLYQYGSTDTISERRPDEHKRATSVGHRGFLAARKNASTPDLLSKAREAPAPLTMPHASAPVPVSVLSPVLSVADEDGPKTPFTPAELHYPRIERVSNDYLSDPESYRNSNSSKHRKSSSYGSYGSYDSAGARNGPPNSSANTTRWSIASSGSMPELMHSRPKSKSSLSRSVISQPLEPLPQSPPGSGGEAEPERTSIPRSQPAAPARKSAAYRQSGESSASDRVVQAVGRVAQRGRPGSYARYSQHLEPQAPPKGGVRESWVAGPDWI